jgi:hypothetical protein
VGSLPVVSCAPGDRAASRVFRPIAPVASQPASLRTMSAQVSSPASIRHGLRRDHRAASSAALLLGIISMQKKPSSVGRGCSAVARRS